jgi:uncharacterized protein YciI
MDNQTLFELVAQARQRKNEKRTKNAHLDWLRKQYENGIFTPGVAVLPTELVGTRSEAALQQTFNRATEKLEQEKLDVLKINDDMVLIVDWENEEVEEVLSQTILG